MRICKLYIPVPYIVPLSYILIGLPANVRGHTSGTIAGIQNGKYQTEDWNLKLVLEQRMITQHNGGIHSE